MSVESRQVKLRLTQDKEVIRQLKRNKAIYLDKDGQITYCCQYDSKCLYFKPGEGINFPKTIADNLQRSNRVIVGDHLGGDFHNILVAVAEWELGEREPDGKNPATTCGVCGVDQRSIAKLAAHLQKHANEHKEKRASDYKAIPKVDWNADVGIVPKPIPAARPEVTDEAIDDLPDPVDPNEVDEAAIEALPETGDGEEAPE